MIDGPIVVDSVSSYRYHVSEFIMGFRDDSRQREMRDVTWRLEPANHRSATDPAKSGGNLRAFDTPVRLDKPCNLVINLCIAGSGNSSLTVTLLIAR